jgi:hypothetical protein
MNVHKKEEDEEEEESLCVSTAKNKEH